MSWRDWLSPKNYIKSKPKYTPPRTSFTGSQKALDFFGNLLLVGDKVLILGTQKYGRVCEITNNIVKLEFTNDKRRWQSYGAHSTFLLGTRKPIEESYMGFK